MEGTPFAQTRKAATSAPVNKDSPEIPSLHAQIRMSVLPKQMSVVQTQYVRTPTPGFVASARLGSAATQTQPVRQLKFAPFANQTLTAPTMPSVRTENACVDRASRLLAPSAWMLTSVAPVRAFVGLTQSVKTPLAPTPAPALPLLWEALPRWAALSPARGSPVASMPIARQRRRTPIVCVKMGGPTTRRILPLDASMSMSAVRLALVEKMPFAQTCLEAMSASASLATPAIPWSAVLTSMSVELSALVALASLARICPGRSNAVAQRTLYPTPPTHWPASASRPVNATATVPAMPFVALESSASAQSPTKEQNVKVSALHS